MTAVREAMIVAGGMGSRLRPLTADVPKPPLAFCGEPFLAGVLTRVADTSTFGVCLLEPDAMVPFPQGPLSFERDVFPRMVADGRHVEGVHVTTGARVGAGARVHRLASGADVIFGERARLTGPVTAGTGVRIPADAMLEPGSRVSAA